MYAVDAVPPSSFSSSMPDVRRPTPSAILNEPMARDIRPPSACHRDRFTCASRIDRIVSDRHEREASEQGEDLQRSDSQSVVAIQLANLRFSTIDMKRADLCQSVEIRPSPVHRRVHIPTRPRITNTVQQFCEIFMFHIKYFEASNIET